MFRFNSRYLIVAFLLFIIEVFIALSVHDTFIRPWGGDFLVVILLYCLLRGTTNMMVTPAAWSILAFSCLIETLQFFQIVRLLGLETNAIAEVVIGTHFSWADILAYIFGIAFILILEKMAKPGQNI